MKPSISFKKPVNGSTNGSHGANIPGTAPPNTLIVIPGDVIISKAGRKEWPPRDTTLLTELERIKTDEFKQPCEEIRAARAAGNETEVKRLKSLQPVFMPAGRFIGGKDASNLVSLSGIVGIDCDGIGKERAAQIRDEIKARADPHVRSAFVSVGGNLAIFFVCDPARPYEESYEAARRYAKSEYNVDADPLCSNVNRLRYFSHDRDAYISSGPCIPVPYPAPTIAAPVAPILPTVTPATQTQPAVTVTASEEPWNLAVEDVRELLRCLKPSPKYDGWMKILGAVKKFLPENEGVELLKEWSPEQELGEYRKKWAVAYSDIPREWLIEEAERKGWIASAAFLNHMSAAVLKEVLRGAFIAKLEKCEYGAGPAPVKPIPRYSINGIAISTPGNLTTISAQAKVGKSSTVGAFIAAKIVAEFGGSTGLGEATPDCLGITAGTAAGALIHVDTEQSVYDHYQSIKRALKRAEVEERPAWLRSFCLAGSSPRELCEAVNVLCEIEAAKPEGIFALIIDGVADLVSDVNEPGECNELIAELHSLAIQYDCSVVAVIHENPGANNGKSRGHLGSQLERKSETNLRLVRTEQITQMFADKCRGAPILKKFGPCFSWDENVSMHVSVPTEAAAQADKNTEELREIAEECLDEGLLAGKTFTELKAAIMTERGGSPATAARRIKAMKRAGVIHQIGTTKVYYREAAA